MTTSTRIVDSARTDSTHSFQTATILRNRFGKACAGRQPSLDAAAPTTKPAPGPFCVVCDQIAELHPATHAFVPGPVPKPPAPQSTAGVVRLVEALRDALAAVDFARQHVHPVLAEYLDDLTESARATLAGVRS